MLTVAAALVWLALALGLSWLNTHAAGFLIKFCSMAGACAAFLLCAATLLGHVAAPR